MANQTYGFQQRECCISTARTERFPRITHKFLDLPHNIVHVHVVYIHGQCTWMTTERDHCRCASQSRRGYCTFGWQAFLMLFPSLMDVFFPNIVHCTWGQGSYVTHTCTQRGWLEAKESYSMTYHGLALNGPHHFQTYCYGLLKTLIYNQ